MSFAARARGARAAKDTTREKNKQYSRNKLFYYHYQYTSPGNVQTLTPTLNKLNIFNNTRTSVEHFVLYATPRATLWTGVVEKRYNL